MPTGKYYAAMKVLLNTYNWRIPGILCDNVDTDMAFFCIFLGSQFFDNIFRQRDIYQTDLEKFGNNYTDALLSMQSRTRGTDEMIYDLFLHLSNVLSLESARCTSFRMCWHTLPHCRDAHSINLNKVSGTNIIGWIFNTNESPKSRDIWRYLTIARKIKVSVWDLRFAFWTCLLLSF